MTGDVFGRIVNRAAGPGSQPLIVQTNPVPYKPVSLDTKASKLVSRTGESTRGEVMGETVIAPTDWAWAKCDAANPFPGTPDPTQICLKNGFEAAKLYQVVFKAADPYVLGVGFCRVARRGPVLQDRAGRRCRHAQPGGQGGDAQHRPRGLAVGQLPARLAAPWLQPGGDGRGRQAGARRAVGPSLPAAALR